MLRALGDEEVIAPDAARLVDQGRGGRPAGVVEHGVVHGCEGGSNASWPLTTILASCRLGERGTNEALAPASGQGTIILYRSEILNNTNSAMYPRKYGTFPLQIDARDGYWAQH